jgi:hypothetical protein
MHESGSVIEYPEKLFYISNILVRKQYKQISLTKNLPNSIPGGTLGFENNK